MFLLTRCLAIGIHVTVFKEKAFSQKEREKLQSINFTVKKKCS
jgi:hypothetical protein